MTEKTPRQRTPLGDMGKELGRAYREIDVLRARITELEAERKQLREAITAMADKSGLEAASAARFRDDAIDGGNEELAGRWNIRHELHAIHAGWLRMLAAS
jgi:hypothetical protein